MACIIGHSQVKYMHKYVESDKIVTLLRRGYRIEDFLEEDIVFDTIRNVSTVALVVGANDIPRSDAEGLLSSMQTLCQAIHEENPAATVIVCEILPRAKNRYKGARRTDIRMINDIASVYNTTMKEVEKRLTWLKFVEVACFHTREGPSMLYKDGFHLSLKGTERVVECLKRAIVEDWTAKAVKKTTTPDIRRPTMETNGRRLYSEVVSRAPAPFISRAPAPFVSRAPAPFVSSAPAPFVSSAPAPFVSSAPAPFVSSAPAPFVSSAPAPLVSIVSSLNTDTDTPLQESGIADLDSGNYIDLNHRKQRHSNSTVKTYAQLNDAKGSVTREELVTDNLSVKTRIFVDLENYPTVAKELCMVKEKDLRKIEFRNYYNSTFDKRHLNTKYVKRLNDSSHFSCHEVGDEKNAADAHMLGDIVQTHYKEPSDDSFVIISGDGAFEVLPQQLYHRKIKIVNPHRKIRDSVKTLVEGPTDEYKNSQKTNLGIVISMLAQSRYKKVYFVALADLARCFDVLKDYLKDPDSAVLVFGMEPEAYPPWIDEYNNRLRFYHTSMVYNVDAPLFLLEYAALALLYELELQECKKAIEFHIAVENETIFATEIQIFATEIQKRCEKLQKAKKNC